MNVVHGSLNEGQFITNGVAIQTSVTGQAEKAIMGVRPEDCSISASAEGTLSGEIFTNELIGDHALVTVDWGDDQISVKAPKDFAGEQGDTVGIIIHRDSLFVFDESNGQRMR